MNQITMSLQMKYKEPKSLVGDIVRQFYGFLNEGGRRPDYEVLSPVNLQERVKAIDFFDKYSRGFVVKQDRLPADGDIRAIVSRGSRVLIETSALDFSLLEKALKSESVPVDLKRKSIFYKGGEIIKTRTQDVGKGNPVDLRTLTTIQSEYGSLPWEYALDTIDLIDNKSCFVQSESSGPSVVSENRLRIELRPELLQQLRGIQLPILAMKMELNAYLVARLAFRANVLRMGGEQFREFLRSRKL